MATALPSGPDTLADHPSGRRHTREQMLIIFQAAREEVQAHLQDGRDILAEFLNERRESGARGE